MQTFLPYKSFGKSFESLDYRRLGKQRVEAMQILNVLLDRTETKGWRNHPIVRMWVGYEPALQLYHNLCITEWINQGYNNTMELEVIADDAYFQPYEEKFQVKVSKKVTVEVLSKEEKKPLITQDDEPNWKNVNELFNKIDEITYFYFFN